ncbi:MAG: hypothetical protein M1834_007335 [Cirrosporium novae-zelandiae]|nr:MAG: hypothetical protein M1834_007335 [Cirrosporium novae-zelandiae]
MRSPSTLAICLVAATVTSAYPTFITPRSANDTAWNDLRGKNIVSIIQIKHVIYLMMENHSFDNIDNLRNISYCNNYTNTNWTVWNEPISICDQPYEDEVPLKDPDHNFAGTSYEIYQKWLPTNEDTPTGETPGDASFVIKAYDEKKTHTLATIAKNFAFWDSYYAEHPGPTNPNRQFATSGSSCGMVENGDQSSGWFNNVTGTSCAKSIFEALSDKNITWKNYYETDIIDSYMYK